MILMHQSEFIIPDVNPFSWNKLLRKAVSISLAFLIFFSFAGYVIPCTIHCIQHGMVSFGESAHTHAEHHDHKQEMDMGSKEMHHAHHDHAMGDCNGFCSIEADNQDSMASHGNTATMPMQFSQLMSQLLSATLANSGAAEPRAFTSSAFGQPDHLSGQWVPMPVTPPPKA